jgi:hypothetical protein
VHRMQSGNLSARQRLRTVRLTLVARPP